ncbi:BTB/POZ domain-containing protein SR1IP1-like isoform X2 [Wolffia australiana]
MMFPLVSKCGLIRRLVSESTDADLAFLDLQIPGGAEAFELAAKFCYGIDFDISADSAAMLLCAAHYLDMTDAYSPDNLLSRTDAYLSQCALTEFPSAITVLRHAQSLLPAAEEANLISRCVDAVAAMACDVTPLPDGDWWADELTALGFRTFERLVLAIRRRAPDHRPLGPLLMLYAQKSLRSLEKKMEAGETHERRAALETVVRLLPRERDAMSVSFLATLLRAAMKVETTVACRLELEKRIAVQLDQAVADDLLALQVDAVQRILLHFLDDGGGGGAEVGPLMEAYLAEVASDSSLTVAGFIGFAELIPDGETDDGMYRAVDIFLKAHPGITDAERRRVCGVMDCQKLGREACAHAAQNSRLPAQVVVQVLYYEQQRRRDGPGGPSPAADEVARLRRENEGLKLEVFNLKRLLQEREGRPKGGSSPKALPSSAVAVASSAVAGSGVVGSATGGSAVVRVGSGKGQGPPGSVAVGAGVVQGTAEKPPLPKKTIAQKLGKLVRPDWARTERKTKAPKDRRHSVS